MRKPLMIILIAHQKGGVGKSTIAVNLVTELQARGLTPVLVDADMTVRTSSTWAGDRAAAGRPGIALEQLRGNLEEDLLALAEQYDHVVVDCAGRDSMEMRTAMAAAHVMLTPIRASQPDLDATPFLLETILEAKAKFNPDMRVMAVLNCVSTHVFDKEEKGSVKYLEEYPELPLASTRLHERSAYRTGMAEGSGVVELKDRKAMAEIQLLTEEVLTW